MPKYYVKSGTLEVVMSVPNGFDAVDIAGAAIWDATKEDKLEAYIAVDERGFREYNVAMASFDTADIMEREGWYVE